MFFYQCVYQWPNAAPVYVYKNLHTEKFPKQRAGNWLWDTDDWKGHASCVI